jgi:hypothetical protein
MNKWELQTCWDSPTVVAGAALQKYASSHFYLITGKESVPGIAFVTPDNATQKTPHSTHPRTELRDISVPDWPWPSAATTNNSGASNGSHGGGGVVVDHMLSATLVVDHVAVTKPETVIAQIHGSVDEEIAKVIKLRWTGGLVEARVKNRTAPFAELGLPLGHYEYGDVIDYTIRVDTTGMLTITVNGKTATWMPPINAADRFYFKCGNYNQCASDCNPTDYAKARFFAFNTTHRAALAGGSSE